MLVSDVLASKGSDVIYTIRPTATIRELLDELVAHNVGSLIVSDDGESMLGIVSERDVVRGLRTINDHRDHQVDTIMTTDIHVCAPEDSFRDLMTLMTDNRVRHVPVLDSGRLVGIVSIGDAVKYRMQQLEFERDQLNSYVTGG